MTRAGANGPPELPKVSPRPLGRPRKAEKTQRSEEIVAHAIAEFAVHGFSGTTVESIARRAQVSKVTIYAKFGDKEGLFRAIGQHISAPVQGRVASVVTAGRRAPEVLRDYASAMRYHTIDSPAFDLIRLAIFEQHRFPAMAEAIYLSGMDTLEPLQSYIEALLSKAVIQAHSADEALLHFCSLVTRGHRFLLVSEADPEDGGYLDRAVDLFLRGAGYATSADGIDEKVMSR